MNDEFNGWMRYGDRWWASSARAALSRWVAPEVVERHIEPAKRWVNKWRSVSGHVRSCARCGAPGVAPGEVYATCCRPFPSKDMAETHAIAQLNEDILVFGEPLDEYLGAEPAEC